MVITDGSRGSYFYLELKLLNLYGVDTSRVEQQIELQIDLILAKITASANVYKFKSLEKYIYMFSTTQRKRKGQLEKLIIKHLLEKNIIEEFRTLPCLKQEFKELLEQIKRKKSLKLVSEPIIFDGYDGKDLSIFNDKENWYNWQKEIYEKLFFTSKTVRESDPRKIIALYDKEGNAGKSSFFKYLFYHHSDDIGRITYGTASQLRSSLINIGPKKIYIIDLTRAKGKYDSEIDLLSAIEDLKGGVVSTNMYGSGNTMLMSIPHIIVSSNYIFDQTLLSKDRWEIYSIEKKELKNITKKIQQEQSGKK
jgi:hypothetical protein